MTTLKSKLSLTLWMAAALLALITAGIHLLLADPFGWNVYRLNDTRVSGTIRKLDANQWGLEQEARPQHKLVITNLPEAYKVDGIAASCVITIVDVIGGDWSVITNASSCQRP